MSTVVIKNSSSSSKTNEVLFRVRATIINDKSCWRLDPIDFTTYFNNPDLFLDEIGVQAILTSMRIDHRFISGDGFA